MLRHVVVVAHEVVRDIVIISPDPGVRDVAVDYGVGFTLQGGLGMNEALMQARTDALRDGVRLMAIISADLPRISAADIQALLSAVPAGDVPSVTIAPETSGAGTNALVLRPPDIIDFRFGQESRAEHLDEASGHLRSQRLWSGPGMPATSTRLRIWRHG